jgi:hypothetical protein
VHHRTTKILDEEKSKHAGFLLAQNGFGPAFLPKAGWLAKGTVQSNTCC